METSKVNKIEPRYHAFEKNVAFKYQIYNGLFLGLPFKDLDQAGSRLSIFARRCEDELNSLHSPLQIVETYLARVNIPASRQFELLFKFLQFIERQVVLFDALEDAAFNEVNDLSGIGSLNYLLNQVILDDSDKIDVLSEVLNYYKVRLVLTAHPTQFYPKAILGIISSMGKAIKSNDIDEIRKLFLQMGLTRFKNKDKPTPVDEARSLIWYLEKVFYLNLPTIQKKLPTNQTNLEIGFWPGGDRDGNPFVTAQVTLQIAAMLRESIMNLYYCDLLALKHRLTFDEVDEMLYSVINKVTLNKYTNAATLVDDLQQIVRVLNLDYQGLFVQLVEDLILKIRMFNFYFAKLDIRQNSAVHKQIIASMFRQNKIHDDYASLNEQEKIKLLKDNMSNANLLVNKFEDLFVNEVIDTVKAIQKVQKTNGKAAIGRYIISNTDSIASIFEVLFLVKLVNSYLEQFEKISDDELIKIEVVPLFETIDDLQNAQGIMDYLYKDPIYAAHLKEHKNKQTIMLGFSDGTKDGGYLRANWSIYLAKKNLSQIAQSNNIHVVFFDGRGGPPSRGGGNNYAFYHALGSETEALEVQLTIQGQTISSNFGTADSAIYNTEQLFTSGLIAKLFPSKNENLNGEQEALIEELAEISYQAYMELRHDEMFMPYLEEITPLKYLSEINIGSRPAKRNKDVKLKLEDLRAIPFVGSWMQMKQNILSFYGLGIGIRSLIAKDPNYEVKLKSLYRDSLFFKTLINNAMQSLYQSNFVITRHLENDVKFGKFWSKLKNEADLATRMLLNISGHDQLLAYDHSKRESINMREKIILPLLIIQQYAMTKLREDNVVNKDIFEKLVKKSLAANVNASRNAV